MLYITYRDLSYAIHSLACIETNLLFSKFIHSLMFKYWFRFQSYEFEILLRTFSMVSNQDEHDVSGSSI